MLFKGERKKFLPGDGSGSGVETHEAVARGDSSRDPEDPRALAAAQMQKCVCLGPLSACFLY